MNSNIYIFAKENLIFFAKKLEFKLIKDPIKIKKRYKWRMS